MSEELSIAGMGSPGAAEIEAHEPHWISRAAFQLLVIGLLFTQVFLYEALTLGWTWLAIPLVLVASHLMHGLAIGFHEASHGSLRRNRALNEFDGILIGMFSFTSFSLYRAAHQTHHMHLATERDEELWPFVIPSMPRWKRCLAAIAELCFGLWYAPLLLFRSFIRKNSPIRAKKIRRRIWLEYCLMIAFWTALFLGALHLHAMHYVVWMLLLPSFIAGNLQSIRKYIEHVGMTGDTPNSATRSIVSSSWMGKIVAFTLLHEPFHGVHHQNAGIPHAKLPLHADKLEPKEPEDVPPFPSYSHAFLHLLRSLADPKVGPQWQR